MLPRRASIEAVLGFAWDAGEFRADHLIAALGFTRATVLSALDEMIDLGLIRELIDVTPEGGPRLGRRPRHFELRGDAGVIVGMDLGAGHVTAVAADLTGSVVVRRRVVVPPSPVPGQLNRTLERVIHDLCVQIDRSIDDVLAVTIAAPGHLDTDAACSLAFGPRFPVLRVERGATLAAIAEFTLGAARGCENFAAVLWGEELGSAVFFDGRPARGVRGLAGDVRESDFAEVSRLLASFYDPELIVVSGSATQGIDAVIEKARDSLAAAGEWPPPPIVLSALGEDAVLLGAVCAARESLRDVVLPLFAERHMA